MNNVKISFLMSAAMFGALLASTVKAGEFNVWSYSKGGSQQDVVVSFISGGTDQEAMVDFYVPKGVTLLKAEVLVAGSVCVGLDNNSYVRVVPPSGAGTALPNKEVDYCRFTFAAQNAARNSKIVLKQKFTECSSPGSEIKTCGLATYDVSETVKE